MENKVNEIVEKLETFVKAYVSSELELKDAYDRKTSEEYIENIKEIVQLNLGNIQLVTMNLVNS